MSGDRLIVVVGSLNADLVQNVHRLPQPGETLAGGDLRVIPGGKGANQACAAARLGGKAAMIGNVGRDPFAAILMESLASAGVDLSGIEHVDGGTGAAAILVLPHGENSIVISPGANARLSAADVALRMQRLRPWIVLCQLESPLDATESALINGRRAGALTILDPAPARPLSAEILSQVDYLTPNQVEAAALLGDENVAVQTLDDAKRAARKLLAFGPASVIVKMGRLGCVLAAAKETLVFPGFEVRAVDSTGAGDVFNGAFAAALAEGRSVQEAVWIANAAGALSVTRVGAQSSIPSRSEVESFLESSSTGVTR